ncbi:hypothetical protein CcaverHIS002_0103930 [Cutaneotrichosporon cavernicola]|nr:hypothetical protein CcaverHIS002_0103930 [Cutaneotrichosporon cavernicola]
MTSQRRASNRPPPRKVHDLTVDSDDSDDSVIPLQPTQKNNKRKRLDSEEDEVDEEVPDLEEEEYEIDYIVDSRWRTYGKTPLFEFLIHWKGYPVEERSWTRADQFEDDDPPVTAFYQKHPRKPNRKQRTIFSLMNGGGKSSPAKPAATKLSRKSMQSKLRAPSKSTPSNPKLSSKSTAFKKAFSQSAPLKKKAAIAYRSDSSEKENRSVASRSPNPESDSDFFASEDDSGDDDFESDPEEPEMDPAPEDDGDVVDDKSAPWTKSGGWGVKVKGPKKAAVKLGAFKSGVRPLCTKGLSGKSKAMTLADDLPPINDIEAIFDHLTSRAKLVTRLNGRKLRVATMCSGTESPLLALGMIAKSVKQQHGVTLGFEHVFSCEIEPFKQAYIERNFAPPVLFRDVTELGRERAHTAYGSLKRVPGNIDILIAGTSCVDYSGLNNEKQDIDANGESGRTFRGMIQWVKKHQPPIVILENVCSAPWDKVVEYFAEINYDANYARMDTKEYYIPHTRTRIYLMATPITNSGPKHLPEKWIETVKDLKRPWSSPFEAFLLPTDDVHIHRARLDLAAERFYKDGTSRKPTDWGRCESRHARARNDEELGVLRPLTAWKEAGVCKGLDWTWNDWLLAQTERVVDLLDISTLRVAKEGIDSGFKAIIWNVSQNVDRQAGYSKTALAPCLTPNMIPWVTNRGGPVTGREALALQGIPVRELLLTSETEDQLADLAGNAMTTTVVGASMLAALHVALKTIPEGEDAMQSAEEQRSIEASHAAYADGVVGDEALVSHRLDLAKVSTAHVAEVLRLAALSSRHCVCEGQSGTAEKAILQCQACGYRSCTGCGGRPEHVYQPCDTLRLEPSSFELEFKELLPMRVQIAGINASSLNALRVKAEAKGKGEAKQSDWDLWSDAVLRAVDGAEFRFRYLKRQTTWTAVYEASSATLECWLSNPSPEWRLTVKAPPSEAVNSRLRSLLRHPVARMRLDISGKDMLSGQWELCMPTQQTFTVKMSGGGGLVPTWEAALGLQGEFAGKTRWSELTFDVPPEATRALDRGISGTYSLLASCGQAQSSLHVKESSDPDLPPLYFFLDATRCGNAKDDRYVFSTSIERLDYTMERDVIASISPQWRESEKPSELIKMTVDGGWVGCSAARLTAIGGGDIVVDDEAAHRDAATYSIPASPRAVSSATDSCEHSVAILSVNVPLKPDRVEAMWQSEEWTQVDLLHHGNATFANLAWITERLPSLNNLTSWNRLKDVDIAGSECPTCAPRPPTIHWIKQTGKMAKNGRKTKANITAFEDPLEAAQYEMNRPSPFDVQLRHVDEVGSFRIGLNIVSLAHRALSRLPRSDAKGKVRLSWRLTPGQVADVPEKPRVFSMPSNKRDPEHSQPRDFELPLRPEQLRSLWWMLEQERAEGKTHTFVEEEISEALLPSLGWRAEGKAERPVMVRGGVIADEVGYGKTIISLALAAETMDDPAPEPAPDNLIDLKATLIIVPGHLSKQWPSEIERFTGDLFNVVVIQNMKGLQAKSIGELRKADLIVIATEVFEAETYWERFEYLSAQPQEWLHDGNGGRFFVDRLDSALQTLQDQTAILQNEGASEAHHNMQELHRAAEEEVERKKEQMKAANFGKRLKGAQYRDKYDDLPVKNKAKKSAGTDSWEADNDDDDELDSSMPKPTFRQASGLESLNSSSIKKDFNLLRSPVLHMFRFRRVIADEFTYLKERALPAILRLQSCFKWVLSGTPPVQDFPSIRSVASFMGIHLGVPDDTEGGLAHQKARAKEQTAAERFHAFRETHSAAWHRRRDDLAQEFLNTFVRQNIAEIDDIPTVEHIHTFKLPASEGAIYLELEHHLQALEMQARKETKLKDVTKGDRNARLEEALSDSKTAEEALLKRCCHFTLDLTDKKRDAKSALEACDHISNARRQQLIGCEEDLRRTINLAVGMQAAIRKKGGFEKGEAQPFRDWVVSSRDKVKHHGDAEAAERLIKILDKCGFQSDVIPDAPENGKIPAIPAKVKLAEYKWDLREQTHLLRRLSKELVARVRSLRFFEVVRKLQQNGDEAADVLKASACGHHPRGANKVPMAVLSCCGHVACHRCMVKDVNNQRCVMGADCHAPVRNTNIVKVSSLGTEGELSSGRFGAKLLHLVNLIKTIPKKERILVFCQWDDLVPKLSEALSHSGITHVQLTGATTKRSNTLESFQKGGKDAARVMLLQMNNSSAAGSNLTVANHAIFLGPLYTPTLYNYRSTETQAIGRVRRFGQLRHVHVHRMLAQDTIDETIFNGRLEELCSKTDYATYPRKEYVP